MCALLEGQRLEWHCKPAVKRGPAHVRDYDRKKEVSGSQLLVDELRQLGFGE
jgi:hypothetical protein